MAIESIAKTLGSGSGIDIGALVTSLVEAQTAAKTADLTRREEKLTAQVSGVAKLKSAITGFDAALKTLVRSGSLASQPTSSDERVIRVAKLPGSTTVPAATTLTVNQLASAQTATTDMPVARTTGFGTGTLTIRFGVDQRDTQGQVTGFTASGPSAAIAIATGDATLDGIAAKINAAGLGLTASVVNDGGGARLTFKGATGSAQAFEIEAVDDAGAGGNSLAIFAVGAGAGGNSLAIFAVGAGAGGTSINARARDAIVTLDGARFTRPTNSIGDLMTGLRLDLVSASATSVTLGVARPGAALGEAVTGVVETFNEVQAILREESNAQTGPLRLDSAAAALARELRSLTTRQLLPMGAAGAPRTLADLGVSTARDGTLSVNAATFARVSAAFPDALEAMFADRSTSGLSGALGAIATRMSDRTVGLDASSASYTRQKTALADARLKAEGDTSALRERLTRQFATMDARTAAYKSTQTFLDNQIKAWNRSDA